HKGTHEGGYRAGDCLPPLALAIPLHPAAAEDVTERPLAIVRHPAQFQRDDDVARDQRRAEAGAQAEKEHATALVAAECWHRRVVDHLDRLPEGGGEVEADPARPEIAGL